MFVVIALAGCRAKYREDLDYSYSVVQTWPIAELGDSSIVQFESVDFEPHDTDRLRALITKDQIAASRDVLNLQTGTGLVAILCAQNGARSVIATDLRPAAVANARYNAAALGSDQNLSVRLATAGSQWFDGIESTEQFDLIIVGAATGSGMKMDHDSIAGFLDRLPRHVLPGGRAIILVRDRAAIRRWQSEAGQRKFEHQLLDDREADSVADAVFPPITLQIRVPPPTGSDQL